MTVTFEGSITIGGAVPLLNTANAALTLSASATLPNITAQLEGLANVSVALTIGPPDIAGTITATAEVLLQLQASISGPTVSLEIAAILSLIAELEVELGNIQLAVGLAASIDLVLGQSGVFVYSYEGTVSALGPELSAALLANPPGLPGNTAGGVLLVGSTPAAIAALVTLFG